MLICETNSLCAICMSFSGSTDAPDYIVELVMCTRCCVPYHLCCLPTDIEVKRSADGRIVFTCESSDGECIT